jgi:hypothetical protein
MVRMALVSSSISSCSAGCSSETTAFERSPRLISTALAAARDRETPDRERERPRTA